ncbi:serpin B9-like [Ixodes scapularis]
MSPRSATQKTSPPRPTLDDGPGGMCSPTTLSSYSDGSLPMRPFCTLTDFSTRLLLHLLRENDGPNVCVSPFGVTVALSMALAGAGEVTSSQMVNVMGAIDANALYRTCEKISSMLNSAESHTKVYLGSKMYVSRDVPIFPEFKETVAEVFIDELGVLDFKSSPSDAAREINSWAEKASFYHVSLDSLFSYGPRFHCVDRPQILLADTSSNTPCWQPFGERIQSSRPPRLRKDGRVEQATERQLPQVVKSSDVSTHTRMVLVSAIYFRGLWGEAFMKATKSQFYVTPTETVPVYMMESLRGAHYCSSKQLPCEALELSYVCRALSLLVLLPDVGTSLETLAAALNYAHLRKLMRELKSVTNIAVWFPRLQLLRTYKLEGALRDMGMQNIFDPSNADLSKMSSDANLCVDSFIHEALFETSEEGLGEASPVPSPIPADIHKFRVDRPFIFVLLHHFNHAVVFVGAVRKP